MIAALAASALAGSCVAPHPSAPPTSRPVEGPDVSDLSRGLVQAHNARRSRSGLPPLFPNPLLEAAAVGHARDMADRSRMSHRGGDGSSPFERIKREDYRYRAAAENVAYGFDDVETVMTGWMKSPGHRRNVLGPYSEIGVGRAVAKDGASYWCVTFGTPLEH